MKNITLQHKAFSADVKISADDERTVRAIISSSAVDREGDVLIPQGLNSKDFEANPVVMYMHSYYNLPIGKVTALKRGDETVEAKIEFAVRPEDHPMGEEWVPDTIFALFQQKVLNAFSVGFIPTDCRAATSRDVTKYGEDCRQVINRWKLLELSVVSIPCNQEAVATAVSKGIITQESVDKLFPKSEETKGEPQDGICPECGAEMAMADDEYTCSICAAKEMPNDEDEDDSEKIAKEPEVKEITREIMPAKRVAAVVEIRQPAVEIVKHVHRFIEPPAPEVQEKTCKVVVRTISKLRGRVWSDK